MTSEEAEDVLRTAATKLGLNSIVGVFPSKEYAVGFADGEMRRGSEELSAQVIVHVKALNGYAVACMDDAVDPDYVEVSVGGNYYGSIERNYESRLPEVIEV